MAIAELKILKSNIAIVNPTRDQMESVFVLNAYRVHRIQLNSHMNGKPRSTFHSVYVFD